MGNETEEKLIVCKRDDVTEMTILISAHFFKKLKIADKARKQRAGGNGSGSIN